MNVQTGSSNSTSAVAFDVADAVLKNVITVGLCISIICINSVLVHIFVQHETFSLNPRYILYIHLVINDIIVLTMLTLLYMLSYTIFTLNVSLCMVLIILAICTNINNPMTLAIMAIECYVAVCFPLHHSRVCTVKKTYIIIAFIWLSSLLTNLPDVFVSLAVESSEFFHLRVFCLRNTVFRHPALPQKRDISYAVLLVIVCLTLLYIYCKILLAAQSASTDVKKARKTILLHSFQLMLSLLTYLNNVVEAGLKHLFPNSIVIIRFFITILITIIPRLVSPLVYGLRDKMFRKYLKYYFLCMKNNQIDI
ncbi:odorant receptor 131-2-like [Periophthalmus magnuspinnatus]|uniref:odorant receptor 131-2-like n=1 Tax=Periophthalmus magnuspinnatus TaxID=409849 RepID=UPI00145B6881|nr:odorant receptor 131-2-like [Periophthalmus magnuspinnatus]